MPRFCQFQKKSCSLICCTSYFYTYHFLNLIWTQFVFGTIFAFAFVKYQYIVKYMSTQQSNTSSQRRQYNLSYTRTNPYHLSFLSCILLILFCFSPSSILFVMAHWYNCLVLHVCLTKKFQQYDIIHKLNNKPCRYM